MSKIGRWIVAVVVLVVLAGFVPAFLGLYAGWRAVKSVLPSGIPATAGDKPRTPRQLASLPPGYHALEVAAPAGGYGALDVTAALPWALAVAQAWQADARLERIDVGRLRPDGTVNVQDDAQAMAMYRFRSPSRVAALREQARLTANAEAAVGLWVRVKEGRPEVIAPVTGAVQAGDDPAPPHPAVLPAADLAGVSSVRRTLGSAPFFNGYMIHSPGEGWVWYFTTLAGESRPRIRAADGAVWPYRGRSAR